MHIKRTIEYPGDEPKLVQSIFPLHYLDREDQVRVGFQKGTLDKATFNLTNGRTIIYERING